MDEFAYFHGTDVAALIAVALFMTLWVCDRRHRLLGNRAALRLESRNSSTRRLQRG